MSTGYINLPVVTDSDVLIQQAIANIQDAIPGWVPREGNLEVLLIEQIALLVAEAATVASDVPDTIFAYFGSLVGVNPLPGASETIKVLWTLANPAAGSPGYQIPAGTIAGFYFSGAAYQFQTVQDVLIPTGSKTATVTMQAIIPGVAYDLDTLAASSTLNLATQFLNTEYPDPLISTIQLTATPATDTTLVRGVDPETTPAYLDRLNTELQLLAPRPITPNDYSFFAQNVASVFRALSFDGVNPFANLLSSASANMTTAPTSASAPTGWTAVGDGTNVPVLSTPGTAPANYLEVTTSAAAPLANGVLAAATLTGATTLTYTVGSGPALATGLSASTPAVIMITDSTNGNEAAIVIGAAAATTTQALTLASPLRYPHSASATIAVLQGAQAPLIGAAPGAAGALTPNSIYCQVSSVVECGSDVSASARPYLVALATYLDGSTLTLSSATKLSDALFDYTTESKTLVCDVPVYSPTAPVSIAPSASAPYNAIRPPLVSVETYVVWEGAGLSKTHYIYYNNVHSSRLRFDGDDNRDLSTSYWNFIPDPDLRSYFYANSALGSWALPPGTIALPGYGIQFLGTGAPLGAPLTALSQVFNLPNISSDVAGTSRNYTAFASVDATYTGSTFGDLVFEVVDMSTGAVLVTGAATNVQASPTSAEVSTLAIPFTVTTAKDVQVRFIFGAGLNVPVNSSVVISQIGVVGGNLTFDEASVANDLGASWEQGGLYSISAFNFGRMVSVCPIDIDGIGATDAVGDTVASYLASRREANFIVNVVQPTYYPIDINWSGYVLPGYAAATVTAAVNTAIRSFLSPATWGGGAQSPPAWNGGSSVVRVFDIASVIGAIPGVGSITSVSTRPSYPTTGAYGATDLTMGGIAPLPIANLVIGNLATDPLNQYSGLT